MQMLRQQEFTLEDNTNVTVTYFLIESGEDKRYPYGIRAEMDAGNKRLDDAEAHARFATREEACAVAEILADGTVTPVTLNEVI